MSARSRTGTAVLGVLGPIAVVVAVLVIWETAVVVFDIKRFVLPAPTSIAETLADDWTIYLPHVWYTTVPILVGFGIGTALGVALAILLDISPVLRRSMYPLILATQTTPKIAIAPLLLVWFGTGVMPKIVIVALLALFPILINVVSGLEAADRQFIVLAESVSASKAKIYLTIKVPSSIPYLFAGLKLAMTVSVIGAIVGEWVASDRGLGYLLVYYNSTLNTTALFAVLVVLVALASALFGAVALLERLLSWDVRQRRHQTTRTRRSELATAGV